MTRVTCHLPLALLVLAFSSSAYADTILFSKTVTRSTGYCCAPFATSALLYWGVYHPEAPLNQVAPVFEERLFTEADIGATFAVDSTSDPDFAYIVSVLTDGATESQGLGFAYLSPEGTGEVVFLSEPDFFAGLAPRPGPDLFGYDIRRLTFTIEHLAFLPAEAPHEVGTIAGRFTYAFEGEPPPPIPEPTTVALLATGLGGLLLRRRVVQR